MRTFPRGWPTITPDTATLAAFARELAVARGGVPHTDANRADGPARSLIVCTPVGFEREFARRAARRGSVKPPGCALRPIPEVTKVGPPIGGG
jgi:hypothetical protein